MNFKELLKTAIKEKDQTKINTLRLLISDVEKLEKSNQEADYIKVIQKAINSRKESLSFYPTGNTELEAEISYLESFLPTQITEADLIVIIKNLIDSNSFIGIKDMKNLINLVNEIVKGQIDNKLIGKNCKELLTT